MSNFDTFAESYGITLEILSGPDYMPRSDDGWEHNAYKVELRHEARTMVSPWKAGTAVGQPTVGDVLESVALDARHAEEPFEDWAAEYGFDTDSRKAERTWRECREQARKLRALLGDDLLKRLECVED